MSDRIKEKVIGDISEMSRRDLVKALGPAAAIGLAGCVDGGGGGEGGGGGNGDQETTESTTTKTTTTPASEVSPGGRLRVGMKVGTTTLDGRSVTGLQSMQVMYNIYSMLLKYVTRDGKLILTGDLAKEWEWEDDTTLVLHLHEDAVFQNGEPVTASDVAYTFDTMYDKPQFTASLLFPRKVTASARDEHTAVIDVGDEPFASLESNLGFILGIINEKADKEGDMSSNPVGSGPFEFVEWVEGDHITVDKFDDYWKEDEAGNQLPYLDGIDFNIFPERSTKLQALRSGNVDWIDRIPPKDVESMKNNDKIKTKATGPGGIMGVMQFNTTQEPFSSADFRKAVLYSIDWEVILRLVFSGVAKRADNQPIPPQTGWDLGIDDPYAKPDPEKAQKHFEKADVSTTSFTNWISRGDQQRQQMHQIIQEQLAEKLDVDMKIQLAEHSVVFEKNSGNDFGFTIGGFNGMFDPDQILTVNLQKGGFFNYGNYVDEDVLQWLKDGRQTLDKEKRKDIYTKIHQRIRDDAAKYYPYWDVNYYGMQPDVMNYQPIHSQEWWFDEVWLDR